MAGRKDSIPTLAEFLLGRDLETAPALRCAVLAHCLAASTLPATYWATILGAVGTTPVCENVVVEAVSTFKDDPDVNAWAEKACHNANMPLSTRLRLCREMAVPFRAEAESLETLPSLDEPFYETPIKGINKLGLLGGKPSRSLALQGSKAKGSSLASPSTKGASPSTKGSLRKTLAGKIALKKGKRYAKNEATAGKKVLERIGKVAYCFAKSAQKHREATAGPKEKVCIHRLPFTFKGTENACFSKCNPKQKGTDSYKRYQKYMRAKTVTAALNLGARKCDLVFDFHRGHMKVSEKK